ncbi:MAG: GH3 auxin-responsive promoter family protein [Chloroflexi bacterium]|nr:GH3 auxin-responsive promoter family protein [Chloroflexota bacterium]
MLVAGRKGLLGQDPQLIWDRYCGFLDLPLKEFMEIQEQLLLEEIRLVADSFLGRRFLGRRRPASVEEFRRTAPLTRYDDYCPYLKERREDVLAEKPHCWVCTSDRSGEFRWVPYTRRAFEEFLDSVMAGFILACASGRGDVNLEAGFRVLHNMPPRPYLSGAAVFGMVERFSLNSILPLDAWEQMDFHDKVAEGFKRALSTGVDIISSMSSVLAKMGDSFGHNSSRFDLSAYVNHPEALLRLAKAALRAKLAGRRMLPRDLWPVKAIVCWGMDGEIYREKISRYWGVAPHELYACTEAGVIGMQSWCKKGVVPTPYSVFLEFIPEQEWVRSRDSDYQPQTVLLNQVLPGQRYELVITSFYGMPLLRYRLGHLVRVVSSNESETGIQIPSFAFEGRCDDLLDVSGFTRLGEKTICRALEMVHVDYVDWSMRREQDDGKPALRLYLELRNGAGVDGLVESLHASLMSCDPFYSDLDKMLQINPIRVTELSHGTFRRYSAEKRSRGLPLELQRPPRTNPTGEDVADLLRLSAG